LYNQIFVVVHKLASSGVIEWIGEADPCNKAPMKGFPLWFKEALSSTFGYDFVGDPSLLLGTGSAKHGQNHSPSSRFLMDCKKTIKPCTSYSPKSQPLFLKIIWPRLRTYGWRIDFCQNNPEEVSYLSPGASRSRKRKLAADSSQLRDRDIARKKSKLLNELGETSLLNIPRSLKFILINSLDYMSQMDDTEDNDAFPVSPNRTVKKILENYAESIRIHFEKKSKLGVWEKTKVIVDGLLSYFDELVPLLLFPSEKSRHTKITDGRRHSDLYGCEYLLRMLMILPSLLRDLSVSAEETKKISFVVEDVTNFLDSCSKDIFDEMFLPPMKETQDGKHKYCCTLDKCFSFPGKESSRFAHNGTNPSAGRHADGKDVDSNKERSPLVSTEDESILTCFTYLAMSQFVVAHAGQMDVLKGKRKSCLRIGYPGIGCGHCLDFIDEGNKYFFASVESLATAPSIVANHLQRCTFCPDDIKQKLRAFKLRHADQRKALPHGSQSVFFNRVWKRLFSSPLPENQSDTNHTKNQPNDLDQNPTICETFKEKDTKEDTSSSENIFHSHTEVMQFIGQTEEQSNDMMVLFRYYYACLARGGQLWNTESMPMQFNSEWLLKEYNSYKLSCR